MMYALEHFAPQGTGSRQCGGGEHNAVCEKHEVEKKLAQTRRRPEEGRVIPRQAALPEEGSAV